MLRDAGVVDAGGQGFTLLLDAFLEVVDGRTLPEPADRAAPRIVESHAAHGDVSELRYEVMYFLDAPDSTIPAFKTAWAALGDSIVVVGGDGLWNCHVHTDDIGGAIEVGIEAGRPHAIRVTDLLEQVEEEQWVAESAAPAPVVHAPEDMVETAVVAIAVGDGVRRLLASLGVQEIVAGGQSMNPSTAQILEAVERCPSESVIVLPNNKNIVPVARQVDALTEKSVAVVPTHSIVEALGALGGVRPRRRSADQRRRAGRGGRAYAAPARSRSRCGTPWPSAGRSERATGSRSAATASASRPRRPRKPRSRSSTS